MDKFEFGGKPVWQPTPADVERAHLTGLIRRLGMTGYEEFYQRSVRDIEWFWDLVIRELGVVLDHPFERILDVSRGIEWPAWCVGGRMNIVRSLLHRWRGTPREHHVAVIAEHEDGSTDKLTYSELLGRVERASAALRELGVRAGDVVSVFLPMNADCVVAMLAAIHAGAIFLPMFSGYGVGAIASRMRDAGSRFLITCGGVQRRGKRIEMMPIAVEAVGSVRAEIPDVRLIDCLELGVTGGPAGREAAPFIASAEDPMMLIYTSGTTGKPKGAVHTHCGFPIKAAADAWLGLDLHPEETIWWMTDMGWMMGPWLVFSSLMLGATMVAYDGAPDYPGVDRMWAIAAKHGVTTLGVSPTLIRSLVPHGAEPVRQHDLSAVRKFASTGEPWNPEPWKWLFEVVGQGRRPIINYSGGTEISGGILMGNMLTPQSPCAFAGPLPGMDADVVDEFGQSVRGQVGELVIRQPWIGQTRGFWKAPDRYIEAYWSKIPGLWVHGDFAAVDETGQWYILGRSDDTIKVAGKRLGPAEIESILVSHDSVKEAAAIGVPDEIKGQALVCFVVLKDPAAQSGELISDLKSRIIAEQGKALAPKEIRIVRDLPKTRNAKVMRRVIRSAYLGQDPGDLSSLENPQAVEAIRAT